MTTRRIATETITAKIGGINTVITEAGQVVPLAYEHLVPEDKAQPLVAGAVAPAKPNYNGLTFDALQDEADLRGLEVEGRGQNGKVRKADLVAALKANDSENEESSS